MSSGVASLKDYERKRSRAKTPEPFGKGKRGKAPIFVIQRHDASRLHYDFRLERDGVLLSWAVPKGVPLEPGTQHLAVHVEDHPLTYATFEGEIPAGNYGAGTVEIWDQGTYELVEEKPNGGMTVRLHGERLDGEWTLVPAKLGGDPKNWLLVKKKAADAAAARKPGSYKPMLATLADAVPAGEEWLHEVKWDGYRAIVTIAGGEAQLTSRNGNSLTARFESVARAVVQAVKTTDCVLDGEVCALDDQGRASFSAMQQGSGPLVLYLFDVLEVEGEPVVDLPLTERHKRLEALLDKRNRTVRLSETFDDGHALFEAATAQRLEGVVSKRADSRYEPGRRSRNWLKVKTQGRQELIVVGYTKGQGRRTGAFGSLVLAVNEGSGLRWAGNVGTGFDDAEIKRLLDRLKPLRTDEPPFAEVPKMPKVRKGDVVWVEPRLVAEVRFAEWTHDGRLRAPVYQGLREDKDASEVHRERAPIPEEIRRGKRLLKLSNLDKPFWPDEGITKGDLLAYYRDIAPVLVPHLKDRPFTMKRYPDGWNGKFFFQKDAPKHMPDWIPTRAVRGVHARPAAAAAADRLPARKRRPRAALGGEHGLHRHEHLVLAGGQAVPARLGALRPRPVAGRRLPGDDPGGAPDQADARPARARVVPEDERLRGDPHPRAGGAAAHVYADARVLGDRRRRACACPSRPGDDGVDEGEAPRRADRLEPERRGQDDRVALLGASEGRRAGLDAVALGRGERVARPGRVHDGGGARARRERGRPVRGRADDEAVPLRRR